MVQNTTGAVELGDGKVFYETAGEGVPLVFVHAGFGDRRMWDDQWRYFSQSYFVLRYDLRGFGRSDRLEGPISRRQELYQVLAATGLKRAILVGCSLGGETVLDAALERPELVAGLILVSATPSGFEMQGDPPQELMEMMAALETGDLALASELQIRLLVGGPLRRLEQVDPLVRQRAEEMNQDAVEKGTWELTFAPPPDPLDPPAVERLDKVKVTTLIIAGELDNSEILRAADVTAGAIPGAHKAIIPNAAHFPNMEKPVEFNTIVNDFLRSSPALIRGAAGQ